MFRLIPHILLVALLCAYAFFPKTEEIAAAKQVVTVWNIDTFEGGKGSRTSFLKRAADEFSKKKNYLFLVRSYTLEGAEVAADKGEKPDILSYGIGFSRAEMIVPLSDGSLSVYWAKGYYTLLSLTDDFSDVGEVLISCGGNNLAEVGAYLCGFAGKAEESQKAYVDFLNGKSKYLFGTQRDVCRLTARGVTFFRKDQETFCDLYECASLCNPAKRAVCEEFLAYLRSDGVQSRLSEIGFLPIAERKGLTVFPLSEKSLLDSLKKQATSGAPRENIEKYLKKV